MKKKVNNLRPPLYRDSGFFFESADDLKAAFTEEASHPIEPTQYIYARYRTPTLVACEEKLATLEDSKWALLTSSGMSAIDLALGILQKSNQENKWLFLSEIYGGTHSYIDKILIPRRGINVIRFSATPSPNYAAGNSEIVPIEYNLERLEGILHIQRPAVLYFEAVSNPMLIVSDARAIIALGKKYNCTIIVDNTFATPYLWKPLHDEADLVVHSVTKYLSGHGDLTGGVLCGNNTDLMQQAIEYRKWVGCNLSPDDAYRLHSQLDTFELRFRQHCFNAFELARFFSNHPKISTVIYPGLDSDTSHLQAVGLFHENAFGGMLTIVLKPNSENNAVAKFTSLLSPHIPIVPSLGDTRTTLMPIKAVWGEKYPIDGAIRISTGIEDSKTLIGYFEHALMQI